MTDVMTEFRQEYDTSADRSAPQEVPEVAFESDATPQLPDNLGELTADDLIVAHEDAGSEQVDDFTTSVASRIAPWVGGEVQTVVDSVDDGNGAGAADPSRGQAAPEPEESGSPEPGGGGGDDGNNGNDLPPPTGGGEEPPSDDGPDPYAAQARRATEIQRAPIEGAETRLEREAGVAEDARALDSAQERPDTAPRHPEGGAATTVEGTEQAFEREKDRLAAHPEIRRDDTRAYFLGKAEEVLRAQGKLPDDEAEATAAVAGLADTLAAVEGARAELRESGEVVADPLVDTSGVSGEPVPGEVTEVDRAKTRARAARRGIEIPPGKAEDIAGFYALQRERREARAAGEDSGDEHPLEQQRRVGELLDTIDEVTNAYIAGQPHRDEERVFAAPEDVVPALRAADSENSSVLVSLGSGNGQWVLAGAALNLIARGYEADAELHALAERAREEVVSRRELLLPFQQEIQFLHHRDPLDGNIEDADIITYAPGGNLTPSEVGAKLAAEAKDGANLIVYGGTGEPIAGLTLIAANLPGMTVPTSIYRVVRPERT